MKSFEIAPEVYEGDEVTEWAVYDADGNFVATFESFEEAEEFVNA